MAVVTLFRNPYRSPSVRDQFDSLAYDLASESAVVSALSAAVSAETHPSIAIRRAAPILQCLEAGQ